MKRKSSSTSQGDLSNAKRFCLQRSTAPLLPVRHQNLIPDRDDMGVNVSTEVAPPAPDLLVQARFGGQVSSIQATPTSTQLSPSFTRNPVSSGSQSGVSRNPSARRVGNARTYRLTYLSTSSTGSQAHVERQVSSIEATPTSTQLSPGSTRNPVSSGSQSGVSRNPSARRVGNARTYRLSYLSTASTGSQAHVERQVSSIQATPTSTHLSPSRTNPVVSGSQSGVHQNSSARRFRIRQNPEYTSRNHSQYQNSQRQTDSLEDMSMNIDDMSYEELLALEEMIGKVNTGIKQSELSNFVKKVICCGEQDSAEQCVICMEQYNDGDEMGLLKCSHDYHFSCISEWMNDHAVCPICRCKTARF